MSNDSVEFHGKNREPIYKSIVNYKFGRLPNWIIKDGLLSRLSGNAVKIFNVLLIFVNNNTGCGKISNDTLSNYSGVCRDRIYKHIRELEKACLLETFKNGWVRHYRLNLKHPNPHQDTTY